MSSPVLSLTVVEADSMKVGADWINITTWGQGWGVLAVRAGTPSIKNNAKGRVNVDSLAPQCLCLTPSLICNTFNGLIKLRPREI